MAWSGIRPKAIPNVVTRGTMGTSASRKRAMSGPSGSNKKMMLQAAKAVARQLPYVGSAIDVAEALMSMRRGNTSSGAKRVTQQRGVYRGKFARRIKGRKARMMMRKRIRRDPYRQKGFVCVDEVTGLVRDPDCVYVGHSCLTVHGTLEMVAYALLRKLFVSSNVNIRNLKDAIPGAYAGTPPASGETPVQHWRIVIERRFKATGVISNEAYIIQPGNSIYTIVGCEQDGVVPQFPNMVENLRYAAGFSSLDNDVNTLEFTKMILYRTELGYGTPSSDTRWQYESEIYMDEQIVHYFASSDIKIQNRSLSASGSADAENVTNNPLVGKLYEFIGGAPNAKVDNVAGLEVVFDNGGVITVRAAELGDNAYREPPAAHNFSNCTRVNTIRIQPGDIKSHTIKVRYVERLFTFLRKLNPFRTTTGQNRVQTKLRGKSALYALEDVINVNLAQNIEIAYEANRVQGCYLVTRSDRSSVGKFSQSVRNSLPA